MIRGIDAESCRTKVSKEKRMAGKMKYSPQAMNREFPTRLALSKWEESRVTYWVTKTERLIRATLMKTAQEQKAEILAQGEEAILTAEAVGWKTSGFVGIREASKKRR